MTDVTREDLLGGLRQIGLGPGDRVVVHSSLSAFGRVQGGAEAAISALQETLTPDGLLLMPSFNHGAPFRPGGPGYYAPCETPTTNGRIPDTFWRQPDVLRSLDPTHAVAAWGRDARRYVENHHRTLTMGPESPLGLLLRDHGHVLLMGVDYHVNTFHHVVETTTGAPCLGLRTEAYPVLLPDGRRVLGRTWGWRERSCPLTDQGAYYAAMASRDRRVRVGDSTWILAALDDCYAVISSVLAAGIDGLPPCAQCPIRPRQCEFTVETDWDATQHCLLPGSTALTY